LEQAFFKGLKLHLGFAGFRQHGMTSRKVAWKPNWMALREEIALPSGVLGPTREAAVPAPGFGLFGGDHRFFFPLISVYRTLSRPVSL